jgi:hypothetical protein
VYNEKVRPEGRGPLLSLWSAHRQDEEDAQTTIRCLPCWDVRCSSREACIAKDPSIVEPGRWKQEMQRRTA